MPRNGSGVFTPSVNFVTEAASPPIEISNLDAAIVDIGDAMTASLASDGQTNPSANLPMNGFRHSGAGVAQALTDYATATDIIDQDLVYYVDSGAPNAYIITPVTPAVTTYEEGQRFVFRATNANTGTSTLNVNGLGTRIIYTPDGLALAAGMIANGGVYEVTYDASPSPDRWVMTSPHSLGAAVASRLVDSGAGLTGGGNLTADRTLAVGAGLGVTVNADDVQVDLTGLTAIQGNGIVAADGYLLDNGGVPNRMAHSDAGVPVNTVTDTTDTLATADVNTFIEYTNTGAVTVTLDSGFGVVGNSIIIKQTGAGQVSLSGTATIESSIGNRTRTTHSVIVLICIAADTWSLFGDMAA